MPKGCQIIDANTARIEIRHPGEKVTNVGHFPKFGFAAQDYEIEKDPNGSWTGRSVTKETFRVTRQDIFESDEHHDPVKGVIWVNEAGEHQEPLYMTSGRNYYPEDDPNDPSIPRHIARELKIAQHKQQPSKP